MRDQDGNILWQGFLLPEEYAEPYVTGTFFINFTATDGLGRLRGHILDTSFYRARQSVMKVIADCLKKTGLDLEIWVDPAIHNELADGRWEEIYVDAQEWTKNETPLNCYDILSGIMQEIGCTLYQQNNKWWIEAITKRSFLLHDYRRYTSSGIPLGAATRFTEIKVLDWYATPTIRIKPPFREITVTEGLDENVSLFPEDITEQKWKMTEEDQDPPLPLHWKGVGLVVPELISVNDEYDVYEGIPIEQNAYVGLRPSSGVPVLPNWPVEPEHYLTLARPVYIKGGLQIDFELTCQDSGVINNFARYYEVTLNGTTLFTNRLAWPGNGAFQFKYVSYNDTYSNWTVKVTGLLIPENGFLDVKIYHSYISGGGELESYRSIKTLSIKYQKKFSNLYRRRRNIDFTTTQELAIPNGGSVFQSVRESFLYQPPFSPSNLYEIIFSAGETTDTSNNNSPLGWCLYVPNYAQFVYTYNHPEHIYMRRENSDFYEYVEGVTFPTDGVQQLVQLSFPDGYKPKNEDHLYVRTSGGGGVSPQTSTVINAREQWYNPLFPQETKRFGRVLGELMHNIYPQALISFEGDTKGLIFPRDVLQYAVKNVLRYFVPVRIEIKPNENTSNVTLIEYKNEKVTDYA